MYNMKFHNPLRRNDNYQGASADDMVERPRYNRNIYRKNFQRGHYED